MKRNSITLLFILSLWLVGCTRDFVDDSKPYNVLNPDIFPESMAQVDYFLNSPYANTHCVELFGFSGLGRFFYNLDHTGDLAWLGTSEWNELQVLRINAANSYSGAPWRGLYRGVQQARTFIDQIVPNYKTRKGNSLSAADTLALRYKLGEAYYLRAWHYFFLMNLYAQEVVVKGNGNNTTPGVILFTSDVKIGDRQDEMRPRSTVKQCWDYVIADLKAAMAQLTDPNNGVKKTWAGADKGRIDYYAAEALLGRALMYEERWTEARDAFLDIVQNAGKSLMSFDDYYNMWNGNPRYSATENNNTEALHQISIARSGDNAMAGGSTASAVSLLITPFYDNGVPGGATPGYGNMFMHDRNLGRFGFPQQYYPVMKDLGTPGRTVQTSYIDSCRNMKTLKRYGVDPDPRLWVCAYQPWVDSVINNTAKVAILPYGGGPETEYQLNQAQNSSIIKHGWSLRKFNLYDMQASQNPRMHGADFYFTRLPEIYLNLAECYWKISGNNTDADALNYINKVHRRAWNLPDNSNQPIDYTAVTSGTQITKANLHPNRADAGFQDQLALNALYYETWAETFGEAKWWFNVRRWNLGPNEAKVYETTRAGAITWSSNNQYALPIIQTELDRNVNCIQNQGY
ncbi:RagB/SusD family nutrient uptake outer membrane protein [Chitinophaga polysaccharea]|uniref:RagB/SusD family nutrient uptake outer membrane protein n=1 Tax=Chitinophaga polysaccharea TaxID=1293035 RepID=UPI001454EC99|nr:RagB/SusD family nutrient uptake outer membrane protein [Chitinophaga polysaccharea]NLR62410.1 RagB/SusD family nutrient uptake outer membrane protein [Chitinophaga polysaccharea]